MSEIFYVINRKPWLFKSCRNDFDHVETRFSIEKVDAASGDKRNRSKSWESLTANSRPKSQLRCCLFLAVSDSKFRTKLN